MKGFMKYLLFSMLLFSVTSLFASVTGENIKTELAKYPPGLSVCEVLHVDVLNLEPSVVLIEPVRACDATFITTKETVVNLSALNRKPDINVYKRAGGGGSTLTKENVIIPVAEFDGKDVFLSKENVMEREIKIWHKEDKRWVENFVVTKNLKVYALSATGSDIDDIDKYFSENKYLDNLDAEDITSLVDVIIPVADALPDKI